MFKLQPSHSLLVIICIRNIWINVIFYQELEYFGCLQVFLGQSGGLDTEGNELPRLVYVSREKRPGFQHHKKAGAMNALVSNQTMTP